MDIENLANYADVIGGAAVIVSLIYVGVQVRRNTKSSQSQTNQSAQEFWKLRRLHFSSVFRSLLDSSSIDDVESELGVSR